MRELTKSITSYTWAMSLFGLQQMVNVFRPAKATQAFNNVTKATEAEFSEALKATFRAGDNLQQGFVDVTFGLLTLGMLDRGGARATADVARQTGEALRQGGRAVSQTVDLIGRTVQTGTSAATGAAQAAARVATAATEPAPSPQPRTATSTSGAQQGWGPMPTQGTPRQPARR